MLVYAFKKGDLPISCRRTVDATRMVGTWNRCQHTRGLRVTWLPRNSLPGWSAKHTISDYGCMTSSCIICNRLRMSDVKARWFLTHPVFSFRPRHGWDIISINLSKKEIWREIETRVFESDRPLGLCTWCYHFQDCARDASGRVHSDQQIGHYLLDFLARRLIRRPWKPTTVHCCPKRCQKRANQMQESCFKYWKWHGQCSPPYGSPNISLSVDSSRGSWHVSLFIVTWITIYLDVIWRNGIRRA